MALENVADGLSGDSMTEVGQCADDPIVTPAGVLAGHPHNEPFDMGYYAWPPGIPAPLGAIELLRNQPAIPRENGGRFSYAGHLRQDLRPSRRPISASVDRC